MRQKTVKAKHVMLLYGSLLALNVCPQAWGQAQPNAQAAQAYGYVQNRINLDAHIVDIQRLITQHQYLDAQARVEKLRKIYPNFLLLENMQKQLQAQDALSFDVRQPQQKALAQELQLRLNAILQKINPQDIPQSMVQLSSKQKTVFLVDAQTARLYVYENVKGRPKYLMDYYITMGKNGIIKHQEGDGKTPIGIYHLAPFLTPAKLHQMYGSYADIYGFGAMPTNFPNAWDRMQGISGSNIWLHGVPNNTYNRAPNASQGCVVLSNADVQELFKFAQVRHTPVIIMPHASWLKPTLWQAQQKVPQDLLQQWLNSMRPGHKAAHQTFYQQPQWWTLQERELGDALYKNKKIQDTSIFYYPNEKKIPMLFFEFDLAVDAPSSTNNTRSWHYQMLWQKMQSDWQIVWLDIT